MFTFRLISFDRVFDKVVLKKSIYIESLKVLLPFLCCCTFGLSIFSTMTSRDADCSSVKTENITFLCELSITWNIIHLEQDMNAW